MARRGPLRFLALHEHEPHRRTLGGLADRLGIGGIVLLALDERLDLGGWDQPHLMAQFADLAAPEVGAAAGFHRHDAGPQLPKEGQNLISPQLLVQNRPPRGVGAMRLKHILR